MQKKVSCFVNSVACALAVAVMMAGFPAQAFAETTSIPAGDEGIQLAEETPYDEVLPDAIDDISGEASNGSQDSGPENESHEISLPNGFSDVPEKHWAYEVILKAVSLSLMHGYDNGKFGPSDNISRAQVAVVLWNMAGQPDPLGSAKSFPDVNYGSYYYDAVCWASSVGVVSGFGDGTFGPNKNVTREQLAAMIANYASKWDNLEVPEDLLSYSYAPMLDADRVSEWARPSISWCFSQGIMSGADGKVNPQNGATRAEAAKMFVFLYDTVNGDSHAAPIPVPKSYVGKYERNYYLEQAYDIYPKGHWYSTWMVEIESVSGNEATFRASYKSLRMPEARTDWITATVKNGRVDFYWHEGTYANQSGYGHLRFYGGMLYLELICTDNPMQAMHGLETDGEVLFKKGVWDVNK